MRSVFIVFFTMTLGTLMSSCTPSDESETSKNKSRDNPILEVRKLAGVVEAMAVNRKLVSSREHFLNTGRDNCQNKSIWIVHFWYLVNEMPHSFPMSNKEAEDEVAVYNKNENTGLDRILLSCTAFPTESKDTCF